MWKVVTILSSTAVFMGIGLATAHLAISTLAGAQTYSLRRSGDALVRAGSPNRSGNRLPRLAHGDMAAGEQLPRVSGGDQKC